jgi:hypothetical protein
MDSQMALLLNDTHIAFHESTRFVWLVTSVEPASEFFDISASGFCGPRLTPLSTNATCQQEKEEKNGQRRRNGKH